MKYPLAEKFFAPQGEGLYTGTPMAFMRFVGCSVGKRICHNCDTDFERIDKNKGGGLYDPEELIEWIGEYKHVCLTGGEPLDRELEFFIRSLIHQGIEVHIETSGTKHPEWLYRFPKDTLWVCVSPKPGYLNEIIARANEIKVILHGLGDGEGWPSLELAKEWAQGGKLVYIQPRNLKNEIDIGNLREALDIIHKYPELRLSVQLHKLIQTR